MSVSPLASMLMAAVMAAALVAALSVVLLRRVTRCEGLYEPEPTAMELECVREYELRAGRLDAMLEAEVRCWLLGRGESCLRTHW